MAAGAKAGDVIPVSRYNVITIVILHLRSKILQLRQTAFMCTTDVSVCYYFMQYAAM